MFCKLRVSEAILWSLIKSLSMLLYLGSSRYVQCQSYPWKLYKERKWQSQDPEWEGVYQNPDLVQVTVAIMIVECTCRPIEPSQILMVSSSLRILKLSSPLFIWLSGWLMGIYFSEPRYMGCLIETIPNRKKSKEIQSALLRQLKALQLWKAGGWKTQKEQEQVGLVKLNGWISDHQEN